MKFILFLPIIVISGSLYFFWTQRNIAKEIHKSLERAKLDEVIKKHSLTMAQAAEKLEGDFYAEKTIDLYSDTKWSYQFRFHKVKNATLKGHLFEGILFGYDTVKPQNQILAQLIPDKMEVAQVRFRIENKARDAFYADGSGIQNADKSYSITIDLNDNNLFQIGNSNGWHSSRLLRTPPDAIKPYIARWKGVMGENLHVDLDLSSIQNYTEDFGLMTLSGFCIAEIKVKIRPISDKVVMMTTGHGPCDMGGFSHRMTLEDNGQLRTILYKSNYEPNEMAFSKVE